MGQEVFPCRMSSEEVFMELLVLKEECNNLIEKIEKIKIRIDNKEKKIRQLEAAETVQKQAVKKSEKKKPDSNANQMKGRKNFYNFYPVFIAVMNELRDNSEFMEYRNYSKYDKKYKKVKKSILDSYVKGKTEYDKREFYELASDYMLIRNDEGHYTYKNDNTEVIYVNRQVLENSGCF